MKTHQQLVVKKFGGTSVGSIERIERVADRVKADVEKGQMPIVIASAMSGETNRLIELASEIDPRYRGPAYDVLLASGEQVAIALLTIALEKRGLRAQALLGFQVGLQTDSIFSKARILDMRTERLQEVLLRGEIPVIAGFQGIDADDQITTLGRGGSDLTAVAVAAALGLQSCEIYTDVPAVFTADPRLIPAAQEIAKISFEEMMEMASLGSKVLHIRSVEMAAKFNVRIHVRSTFEDREGTWIVPEGEIMENPMVSSVTHDPATVIFKLFPVPQGSQFPAQLFSALAESQVVVDIITQSENEQGQRLAFSTTEEDVVRAQNVLDAVLKNSTTQVNLLRDLAKISVVGVGMRNHPGVAATFFKALADEGVSMSLVTTSEIKISAVIDRKDLAKVAQRLHKVFGLDQSSAQ